MVKASHAFRYGCLLSGCFANILLCSQKDKDYSGSLNHHELKKALQELGYPAKEHEMFQLVGSNCLLRADLCCLQLQLIDRDRSGSVSEREVSSPALIGLAFTLCSSASTGVSTAGNAVARRQPGCVLTVNLLAFS